MNRLAAGECRVWARSVRGSLQLERTRSVFFWVKFMGLVDCCTRGLTFTALIRVKVCK